MIVEIEAKFSCDDCGTEFVVGLDPAIDLPPGWTLYDAAEDAVRGGSEYRDGHGRADAVGSVGDDGRHYCDRCTRKRDGRQVVTSGPEDNPADDEPADKEEWEAWEKEQEGNR